MFRVLSKSSYSFTLYFPGACVAIAAVAALEFTSGMLVAFELVQKPRRGDFAETAAVARWLKMTGSL